MLVIIFHMVCKPITPSISMTKTMLNIIITTGRTYVCCLILLEIPANSLLPMLLIFDFILRIFLVVVRCISAPERSILFSATTV